MYPRASKQIWDDVQRIVAQLGLRTQKNDKKRQVLVTAGKATTSTSLPMLRLWDRRLASQPLRLRCAWGITANREPARVVVE